MQRAFKSSAALVCGVLALAFSLWAQKPKSQKEAQAIVAVQNAKTLDERIQAIENVLDKYADTEYKVLLLQMAIQVEEDKGDYAQTVFYANRLLKADPKNAFALVNLAAETARHTREFDLDKDEKLANAEKWANEGIEDAKTMPKLRADITDEQWEATRKDMEAQGYEALGMADVVRKNYAAAAENYKQALITGASPQPATLVRLAQAYASLGKADDAIYTLDKAINTVGVSDQIKSVAQTMKQQIEQRKAAAGAKPPAAPAAGGAAPAAPAQPPATSNHP